MGACLCKTKRRCSRNDHLSNDPITVNHSSLSSSSSSGSSSEIGSSTTSSSSSSASSSSAAIRNNDNNRQSGNGFGSSIHQRIRSSAMLEALSLSSSYGNAYISRCFAASNKLSQEIQSGLTSNTSSTNKSDNSQYDGRNNNNSYNNNSHHHTNNTTTPSLNNHIWSIKNKLSMHADKLVLETLESIRPTVLNEPSNAMQKLHLISETELGWLVVISSLINKVDLEHPFGSALILMILEDAPLPTKNSISKLDEVLCLQTIQHERSVAKQRNISIVLGCLAEKLAGTLSSILFSEQVQQYLLTRLELPCNKPIVILYSLIALEKFAQTIDNKLLIMKHLNKLGSKNPLIVLEKLTHSKDYIEQQVGFCARWGLDNYFLFESRPYSFEICDRDNLNVMLNSKDASENLKISADGLIARNDTSRFESVRCTYAITSGIYYYEVLLLTPGVMQIGFATKQSKFSNHDGFGIGDDDQSFAYDGCRQLLWQNAKSIQTKLPRWKEGDIVGCLIDLQRFEIRFSLNGQIGEAYRELFKNKSLSTQYYAAASFMPFQQCVFNFGRVPFAYPPEDYNFKTFNQCTTLSEDNKIIMPRHLILRKVHSFSSMLNTCTICCDNLARITLYPCDHTGFCETCADLLSICPLCRTVITSRRII